MASTDSTVVLERTDHQADAMSAADRAAHDAASYVRRPAVIEQLELPPLPAAGTPERRRAMQLRGW